MSFASRAARLASIAPLALAALGSSSAAQNTPNGVGTAGTGAITPTLASGNPAIGNTAFAIEVGDARTNALRSNASSTFTDNVTDARCATCGRNL